MLDAAIIEQLKTVFTKLDAPIALVAAPSAHNKAGELSEMLSAVATTSDFITTRTEGEPSPYPRFWVHHDGAPSGIAFSGIPGGHEFTSLILAVLNANGKGKLPDDGFIDRVRRLNGPIRLRTYVSLSCENCPDVVQALNLMATFHDDFEHEMVDGGYVPEEIEALAIQGVPSVIHDGKLLSSGKTTLAELLTKLEATFGSKESEEGPRDLGDYDIAVVGGGPAGISTAIYTARKGLKTVLISDRIGGQLQDTKGIENMIGVRYTEGPELAASMANHMAQYDIDVLEHRRVASVVPGADASESIALTLDSGEALRTARLIIATGAKWRELGVEGERDYLGRGVAYCPHCDGPYYKGKDIAVIGGGNSGVEAALDLAGIVKSVTVIEYMPDLKADAVLVNKLEALPNAKVLRNHATMQVVGDGTKANGIVVQDRGTEATQTLPLEGVFVQIGLVPNSQFVKDVVETTQWGEIIVDDKCRTNVPNIYAAGDVTVVPYKQIVVALGEGSKAGLAAFEDGMMA